MIAVVKITVIFITYERQLIVGDTIAKPQPRITPIQFKVGVAVVSVLLLIIFFYNVYEERFTVRSEPNYQEPLVDPDNPLKYNNEFCASRITDLIQEINFIEKEISKEKELLSEEETISSEESKVIKIEQRELSEVKEEFEEYKSLCEEFDEQPTVELCDKFLLEAEQGLELAEDNANQNSGLTLEELTHKDLRKATRVYEGLQEKCKGL